MTTNPPLFHWSHSFWWLLLKSTLIIFVISGENWHHTNAICNILWTANPPAFWLELKQLTDGNDKPKFDVSSALIYTLVALLHSSVCAERMFSQVNIVKTKQCNKLLCETVSNRILDRQAIKKGGACHTWNPCNNLLEDVREGCCKKRYKETIQLHMTQRTLIVDEVKVVDSADVEKWSFVDVNGVHRVCSVFVHNATCMKSIM